jgi:hypothetical protein
MAFNSPELAALEACIPNGPMAERGACKGRKKGVHLQTHILNRVFRVYHLLYHPWYFLRQSLTISS